MIGKLRRVLRSEWGLKKKAVCVLYKGLFLASVMYVASVWYEIIKYEYARKIMNRCQKVVLSSCLDVCRTVSTEAMQVMMGGLPWDLECVRRDVMYKMKNSISMSENDVISNEEVRGMDVEQCVELVSDRLYERWQRRWDESVNGRVAYGFIKNVRFAEMCGGLSPACDWATSSPDMEA